MEGSFLHRNGKRQLTGITKEPFPTKATMKVWSLIWLSAMLTTATEAGRSRYVPNHGEIDHRELQSDNVRVIGKAYECTDNDFEIPEGDFRDYEPGDLVKFCIKPDIRSENRGIVMRSIDRMNLKGEGSGRTQRLIENKREKFTTLALCIPGQLVCSFRTRLSEELFWSAEGEDFVNITGVALVSFDPNYCRRNSFQFLLTNTFYRFPWSILMKALL